MIDVAALSAALPGEAPCGIDLEHDPEFQALEWAARGTPSRAAGAEGNEVDWPDVRRRAESLLLRTRDLRVDGFLALALTATEGLAGAAAGVQLIQRTCEQLWDHVFPLLDASDNDDPMMRLNALQMLAHPEGLPRMLRGSTWFHAPGIGPVRVRTAEMVLGLLPWPEETEPELTPEQLKGLLGQAAASGLQDDASATIEAARMLQAVIDDRCAAGSGLDLRPLINRLKPLAALYAEAGGAAPSAPGAGLPAASGTTPLPSAVATIASAPGQIASRRDAMDALERVCAYLERHEPANPAPLLIRRAQKLMNMSFLEIVRDVAPEGMASLAKIAGLTDLE